MPTEPPSRDAPPSRPVILLGASNVRMSMSLLAGGLPRLLGEPLDLFIAHGYGRSYGVSTREIVRFMPGIRDCDLWSAWPDGAAFHPHDLQPGRPHRGHRPNRLWAGGFRWDTPQPVFASPRLRVFSY